MKTSGGLWQYHKDFWRTLKTPKINCQISLMLAWSKNCFLVAGTAATQGPTVTITDTKLYVPAVTS